MTTTQRLQIRASEERSRLAELAGLDELDEGLRAELGTLGTTHQDTESQLRAAIAVDGDPPQAGDPTVDPEVRERIELRGRASFGRYLYASLTGAQISGAEAEFQAACGVPGIPLDLFEIDRPTEVRADTASGVPATGAGSTLAPIQPYVFSQSIAPMLGIEMPSVGSGAYSEMTISTPLSAAAKDKGSKQDSTAAVLTSTTASPRSIRGRLTLNLEDVAQIGGTLPGRLAFPESQAGGGGAGRSSAPQRDFGATKTGWDSPISGPTLYAHLFSEVSEYCGVPGALVSPASAGPAAREAFRRLTTATLEPYCRLLESELSRVLETTVTIALRRLGGVDAAGRARALHVLTEAGFEKEDAADLLGWD